MHRNINSMAQIVVVCILLTTLLLPGCSSDDKTAATPGDKAPAETVADTAKEVKAAAAGSLTDALASWQAGKKDEAVKEFVDIDWSKTTALPKSLVIQQSEANFKALDKLAQTQQMTSVLSEVTAIKTLCASVLDAAAASADSQKYYDAVLKFANMLSTQKSSMVSLKKIGDGLKNAVQKAQAK